MQRKTWDYINYYESTFEKYSAFFKINAKSHLFMRRRSLKFILDHHILLLASTSSISGFSFYIFINDRPHTDVKDGQSSRFIQ